MTHDSGAGSGNVPASRGAPTEEPVGAAGEGETIATRVPAPLSGVRVDRGVAMIANVSRAKAAELIGARRVLVDGSPITTGRSILEEGTTLTVLLPAAGNESVLAEPTIEFDVVYADEVVAVVDKPAGLVVHPGAGHGTGTLVGGLLARFPDLADLVEAGVCAPDRPGIVHRLDKGTSGLLVVARTAEAYRALTAQLATRTMQRRYLALVVGTLPEDRGEIEAPIGRSPRTPTKMAVTAGGKPASTTYAVLERRDGERPTTLLEVSLRSGRTHQIRVHMAAIGHPVVGDARYGSPDRRLGSGRFFLHAAELTFEHPTTGTRMRFSASLPPDLQSYLERLPRSASGADPVSAER